MSTAKIAISLNSNLLKKIDSFVKKKTFPNRSQAIQLAIEEKLARLEQNRLAIECAKLDPSYEKALAEEGFDAGELEKWPEY